MTTRRSVNRRRRVARDRHRCMAALRAEALGGAVFALPPGATVELLTAAEGERRDDVLVFTLPRAAPRLVAHHAFWEGVAT